MAETAVLPEENQTQEQEEASEQSESSRRGGRPPGARNKPKESIPFFDLIRTVDYNNHQIHLFRVEPLTDRRRTGDYAYIQKFAEPFDEDTVLKDPTWGGSGVYRATLYYEPPGTKKQKEVVAEKYFEVIDQAYPPRFPLSQWIDEPKNKKWAWAKAILEREQGQSASDTRASGGSDAGKLVQTIGEELRRGQVDPTQQFKAQTEAYQTGLKQGIETGKQAPSGDSSLALLEKLIPLLTPKPQDDSVVKVLTLQLEAEREQRKADREQGKADREAADKRAEAAEKRHNDLLQVMIAKKENTGMDVIQQFTGMFNMFKQITEGGLGANDDSWSALGKEALREIIPHAAPAVAPMLTGLLSGAAQFAGGGPRPAALPPGQPPPQPAPGQAPPPQAQPQQQLDPQFAPAYTCIFMSQGALLNAMRTGKSGLDFGDWLANGPGELEIEKLRAAGPDRIIQFISVQLPPLWAELQPVEAKFRTFLGELMAWTPQEDDGTDEPAAESPEPVFPGRPAKKKAVTKKGAN